MLSYESVWLYCSICVNLEETASHIKTVVEMYLILILWMCSRVIKDAPSRLENNRYSTRKREMLRSTINICQYSHLASFEFRIKNMEIKSIVEINFKSPQAYSYRL